MYFKLYCQYPNGNTSEKKIATTLEKAKEWARLMNENYPQIRHWFSEVVYSSYASDKETKSC